MPLNFALITTTNSLVLAPYLEALKAAGIEPSMILGDGALPEKAYLGAKQRLGKFAEGLKNIWELEILTPTYFVKNHNDEKVLKLLTDNKIDFLINAGTPRILKKPVLMAVKGIINVHPGILPDYRGCSCVEWSIFYGDPVGATAHLMSQEIDEGPLLANSVMKVKQYESFESVRWRMLFHQAEVLISAIRYIVNRDGVIPVDVRPQGSGKYHKTIDEKSLQIVKEKLSTGEYFSR